MKIYAEDINTKVFREAYKATCQKRDTVFSNEEIKIILDQLKDNEGMNQLWDQFRKKNYYVAEQLDWYEVLIEITTMISTYVL